MSSSIDDITGEVVLFCRVSLLESHFDTLSLHPLLSNHDALANHNQIFIKHEEISRFLGMLEKMKVQVQSEPGTLEYSWALDEKENEILLWERYTDAAAFRA